MLNSLFKVNGKPFFSIGGQTNNSSAYDASMVERALKAVSSFHMNTIAMPVYWETLEKTEGSYDDTQIDMLIDRTRAYGLHLVILWFGTWKNGKSHYVPEWVKEDHARFKWAECADHTPVRTLSPHCRATLEADKKAFVHLCKRIEEKNTDETVLGIQVENEAGMFGTVRDYGEEAEKAYRDAVPAAIEEFSGKEGSWEDVFGSDAAECFSVYAVSRFIDEIAAAGKEITKLPMYVNVALGEMYNRIPGIDYPSGGAVTKVLKLFRLGVPHIDAISPDIYLQGQRVWDELNTAYSDGEHPYYIPELLYSPLSATRAIQAVVENGLSGVHYFGIDMLLSADGEPMDAFRESFEAMEILSSMKPLIEKFQGESRLYAVTQYEGESSQYFDFGDYTGTVHFDDQNGDMVSAGPAGMDLYTDNRHPSVLAGPESPKQRGKGIICYMGGGEFYLAGSAYRLVLYSKKNSSWAVNAANAVDSLYKSGQPFLSVEEGYLDEDCNFEPQVRRNGDESDYGFWVTPDIGILRVRMDTNF